MKKLLSLILALILSLGVFSSVAFAAEDDIITLNFWGWGTEWVGYYEHFLKTHPDSNVRINVISKSYDDYQMALDIAFATNGAAEDYPDLFCAEVDFVEKYVNSDYALPLSTLGVDWDAKIEAANVAPYTLGVGASYDGVLKGVAMQNTAVVSIYRASIAEEVLGTSDPMEVYEYVKDVDTFINTCKMIKEKAGDTVNAISAIEEITCIYYAMMENPYVNDGVLHIDNAMLRYIMDAKNLVDQGMCTFTGQYSQAWYADFNDLNEKKVLFYTGAPWKFNACMRGVVDQTMGDWRVTYGPADGFEGGTWLCVGRDTDPAKYEAIAEYLNFWVFDTEDTGMSRFLADSGDCPSSITALNRMSADFAGSEICGGQNTLEIYAKALDRISADNPAVKNWNRYSNSAQFTMESAANALINGEVSSLTEAVQFYIDNVTTNIDCAVEDGWEEKVADFEASYVF
jgi:multiple sugar transport system substrate-binding protein